MVFKDWEPVQVTNGTIEDGVAVDGDDMHKIMQFMIHGMYFRTCNAEIYSNCI